MAYFRLKGMIFDKDGTLFDTERLFRDIWKEMGREYGVEIKDEWLTDMRGRSGEDQRKCLQKYLSKQETATLLDEFTHRTIGQMKQIQVKPGVLEILQYLRKYSFKTAVASGANRIQIQHNIKNAKIEEYIDVVVSGEEVAHGKPAPDIYLRAAEKLGLKPEECYAVEDSINGVKAAHDAGCFTIMIPDLETPQKNMGLYYNDISRNFLEVLEKIQEHRI